MDFAMDNDLDMELLSLKRHAEWHGKVGTEVKVPVKAKPDMAMAYVPGCIEPCLEIEYDEKATYAYTGRGNRVAVITDGSSVLNLGNIGPAAALPMLEGKCALLKAAAGIDAVPLCIEAKDTDEFVNTVGAISKNFGAISLTAMDPMLCSTLEERLSKKCSIPVWADDLDSFALSICAGIINTARYLNKDSSAIKTFVKLTESSFKIVTGMAEKMGLGQISDKLESMNEADLFIDVIGDIDGLQKAKTFEVPLMLGLAEQKANLLVFPGVFKGLLDARVERINDEIKEAAARALAYVIYDDELYEDEILPGIFETEVIDAIAGAIVDVAGKDGFKENV